MRIVGEALHRLREGIEDVIGEVGDVVERL